MFSHQVTEWGTPRQLYERLNTVFKFDLDPCTTEDNPLNTPCIITKKQDGLKTKWFGNVFVNPPYNEIEKWLDKAMFELGKPQTFEVKNIVFLLPARTDTKWFHNYIYTNPFAKIYFLKGRIKFRGAKNSAPFPSMIVIFSRNK